MHRVSIRRRLKPPLAYWIGYGRALARVPRRGDDAVLALCKAEQLFPIRVQRNPLVREVLGELLVRSRRDAVGRELRGMACRAGLPLTTRLRWRRSVRGYTPPSRLGPHAWALTLGPQAGDGLRRPCQDCQRERATSRLRVAHVSERACTLTTRLPVDEAA